MADRTPSGPPPSRREDVVDVLHGVDVDDPYRWLESGDAPEVHAWAEEQNRYTRQALEARPDRGRWHERLSALVALPTALTCKVAGDRLFVLERAPGADQFALVLRSAVDADQAPRTLLDPAGAAADAAVAIDWFTPSPDGRLVALGLSEGGTEDSTLHLLDVDRGELLDERIPLTRAASVAWRPDGSGFWYARYPEDDQYHRHIRFHAIGASPADDPIVFDRLPNPQAWPDVQLSSNGRYLVVHMLVGWGRYDVHVLDVASGEWRAVVEGIEAITSVEIIGDRLVAMTTHEAPNGRLITAPIETPTVDQWRTIVRERADVVLGAPHLLGDRVLVTASRAAVDRVESWSLPVGDESATLVADVDLGLSAVQTMFADDETGFAFATVSSFGAPTAVVRLDGDIAARWCPDAPPVGALEALTVRHLSYPSLDGTEIGLFLIHRHDVVPGPDVPTVLNGYGGFAITESPMWVPNLAAWCAEGGVWAIAGLRGGAEHGETWHHAGRRGNKQSVFDDFHSAGDWLVEQGFASHERLALVGGSNGGLLVGAALTQRPDLARAVWCAVPLLDMIRFPQFLIARLWTDEYGDPDVPEEFGWLYAYSPYHAVERDVQYPAVLFTTAEGDTRVDPLHARKMAAMLQSVAPDQRDRPVFLLQAGRAGHGVGKPASMRIVEGVDVLSFLWWQLMDAPA